MSKFDDAVARMRNWLESPLSKIEGTFSMFNIRAVAKESAQLQNEMEIIENNYSLDTATGEYLDVKAGDYGVYRRAASYATGEVTITGTDGTFVPGGTVLVAPEYGVQFVTQEARYLTGGSATVPATCTITGPSGNVPAGAISQLAQEVAGVASVTNASDFSGGTDREDDDNLRMRTYFKIRYPATSGNVYHYQQWATDIAGVGKVKVFPLWNGAGTVKVSILDGNGEAATPELIKSVQDYIDPEPHATGAGMAPVGALVTVTTASEVVIHVAAAVSLGATSSSIGDIQTAFRAALDEYFRSVAYDGETVTISAARVGNILFDTQGVIDYTDLTINTGTASIPIGEEEIPVVGMITLTLAEGA